MALGRVFDRHFVRVEGTDGLYKLRTYQPDIDCARENVEAA